MEEGAGSLAMHAQLTKITLSTENTAKTHPYVELACTFGQVRCTGADGSPAFFAGGNHQEEVLRSENKERKFCKSAVQVLDEHGG